MIFAIEVIFSILAQAVALFAIGIERLGTIEHLGVAAACLVATAGGIITQRARGIKE